MIKKMPHWVPWILAATLLWGVWGAFSAAASRHGNAFGQVAGAVIIEGIVMLPLVGDAWKARSWALVGMGIAGLGAYFLFFKAISVGGSHLAPVLVAIGATYPVITYLISLAFFGGRLSLKATIGIVLAVSGTALLSTAGGST